MALIKCPECSKEVSDKAKTCPHCGYPLTNNEKTNTVLVNGTKYNISNIKKQYDMISEENKQRLYKRASWQYRCCLNPELIKKLLNLVEIKVSSAEILLMKYVKLLTGGKKMTRCI